MSHPSHLARPDHPGAVQDKRARELTEAALTAARLLGLSPSEIASTLGVPQGALKEMQKFTRLVDGRSGEAERADALVRVARRLKALLGDQETLWRSWLRQPCADLDDKPLAVMTRKDGVLKVAQHLERARELKR
jgi:hypothetical protein